MKEKAFGRVLRAGAWGVLIGGAAGFTLGLLLAPEEGQKVRRRLAYHLEHLADQMGYLVDQILKAETGNEARRRGDAVVADARDKAQRIRDDIDALLGEVRRKREPRRSSSTTT
jgi:gas vesicle protein